MKKILKKALIITGASLLAIVGALGITVGCVWGNEISTMASFKKIQDRNDENKEGSLYEMNVKGDYYFDELIETGVSTDKELINYITGKITKGLIMMNIGETEIACSAFTGTLENGDRIFARNYDFAKTNTAIVYTHPSNRFSSVSTVDLNYLGLDVDKDVKGFMNNVTALAAPFVPLDGVNEKGLACGIFMSYQGDPTTIATDQKTDKIDMTSTVMLRMILDYCDSVESAVNMISKYDLHDSAKTSFHYMIADKTGKSAVLEWIAGTDKTDNDGTKRELVVTYNDADDVIGPREAASDYQVVTNFIIRPDYYESNDDKPGWDRYELIYDQLEDCNATFKDEKEAAKILQSVGRRTFGEGNGCTVHSCVFNLTKGTNYFVPNEHFDDAQYCYNLNIKKK